MPGIRSKRISQDPTVTAGGYSAGDAVGGLLTFADVTGSGNGQTGAILESVVIVDEAAQAIQLDLVLFNATFTATADNAAFDPTDADLLKSLGFISVSGYSSFTDNALGATRNVGLVLPSTADGAIYGQLVTRGTPTYAAATDIAVIITVVKE